MPSGIRRESSGIRRELGWKNGRLPEKGVWESGEMTVYCWCMEQIIRVPPSVIKAGKTGSCGKEGCRGMSSGKEKFGIRVRKI